MQLLFIKGELMLFESPQTALNRSARSLNRNILETPFPKVAIIDIKNITVALLSSARNMLWVSQYNLAAKLIMKRHML